MSAYSAKVSRVVDKSHVSAKMPPQLSMKKLWEKNIHPSSHLFSLSIWGSLEVGAYPSCHRQRGRVFCIYTYMCIFLSPPEQPATLADHSPHPVWDIMIISKWLYMPLTHFHQLSNTYAFQMWLSSANRCVTENLVTKAWVCFAEEWWERK